MTFGRTLLTIAACPALALALTAAALAGAGAGAPASITACAHEHSGKLRAVTNADECRKNETALVWNIKGPKGDPGEPGPAGAPGPGIESIEQLAGLSCAGQGKTVVSVADDGSIDLRCNLGAPSLRVNELMTGATGAATDEFVEIVNAGDGPARFDGYRLVYRSAAGANDIVLAVVPAGVTLRPGGRYLFAGSGYSGSAAPDQAISVGGLSSSGGGVALRDPQGALVDSVGYGPSVSNGFTEGSPAPAPPVLDPPGASIARIPDGQDTNDNAADLPVLSPPTPGLPN